MGIFNTQESSPLMQESPRPLLTMSTASIPVFNTLQRLYIFTHESWFTLSPEVISLLTHYQGRSAGITMEPFKSSSNMLGLQGFLCAQRKPCGPNRLDELLKGSIVIPADLSWKWVKRLITSGERVNHDSWVKMYNLCRVLKLVY